MSRLHDIIALGEGFTTEFKRSGTSHLGRELCAFANATGGLVLIGVTDDGAIVGVNNLNRLKSEVQNIARAIEPPLLIDLEVEDDVLIVSVPPQNGKPYSTGGKFYLRDGASSRQMTRNEIREFFFKEGVIRFDEMRNQWYDLDVDLTEALYARFAKRAGLPEGLNARQALENLHLVRDGYMTNAGAWLLAEDILKFNSAANVSCALFMGVTKTRILDRKDFNGDVYSNYQATIDYLLDKLNTELIITGHGRDERPELPEEALREAVVNALAHRDYRSPANVQVYIFQDRVEIVSPGGLPAGMTEKLLGRKSIPRNPLLFGMLYRMNAVEHVGSGIRRIREICRKANVPAPEIEVELDWITLRFRRIAAEPEKSADEKGLEVREGVTGGVTAGVTAGVKRLRLFIASNPGKRIPELSQALNVPPKTLERWLRDLRKQGLVEFRGASRSGGYWSILHASGEGVREGVNEGVTGGVREGVKRLQLFIASNPGKRIPELSQALNVPPKTLERRLRDLRKQGLVEFRGAPRTGGYWVTERAADEGERGK
ncbi:MAG: hypothetical protein GXP31_09095 [Kiritimatiellaeota bacterium]|nr:hypothetical protein [Kiritimatiellota bacterium]